MTIPPNRPEPSLDSIVARLREAERIARLGSWELILPTNELRWSDGIFAIFEIDPARFGASYEAFLAAIHPDDREAVDHAYWTSVDEGTPYDHVHRLLMPDGRVKWVRERGHTERDAAGHPVRSVGTVQDITDQMDAQLAQALAEQRYRVMFEHAGVGVLHVRSASSTVLQANAKAAEILGYPQPESLLHVGCLDLLHPDDLDCVLQRQAPLIRGEVRDASVDARMIRRDGRVLWVRITLSPVWSTHGGVEQHIAVLTDIDEQRRAEDALRRSERFNRVILDTLTAHMAVVAPGGTLQTSNAAWAQCAQPAGLAIGSAEGTDYLTILDRESRDAADPAAQLAEHLRAVLDGRAARATLEYTHGGRDYALRVLPLADQGAGALVAHVDVSDRKAAERALAASEARFHDLFDASPDAIVMVDPGGRIALANPQVRTLLGYDPDELVGRAVEHLIPEASRARHVGHRTAAGTLQSARRMGARPDPFPARRRDGTIILADIALAPLRQDGATWVIASLRDATERVRLAEERQRLEDRLHEAQRVEAIGRFAGGVAHDLANLLSPIATIAELAREDLPGGDPAAAHLDDILHATHRAVQAVRQILEFSRGAPLRREPVDIGALAREVCHRQRHTAPPHVRILQEVDSGLPLVEVDPGQIDRVLTNLIVNATHAIHGHAGQVRVQVRADAPRAQIVVAVSDDGRGMSEETLAQIFEPYFTTKGSAGTGLGLAIVRRILTDHGATIEVSSQPGVGSQFTLRLPLPPPADASTSGRVADPH